MNSVTYEILSSPKPLSHIACPYTDETQVVEAVCLFAGAGLRKGEAVVLIMESAHCDPIKGRLAQEGFDLTALQDSGQLVCENASDLLPTFLFDGIIDELRFKTGVGAIIERAKAGSGNRPVRVFEEIADLIWTASPTATKRLEELWNEVIEAHGVPLLCAYSLAGSRSEALPRELLERHSHATA